MAYMRLHNRTVDAIVVGGSAGALQLLRIVLGDLPTPFPIPIFLTLHLPARPSEGLRDVLQIGIRVPVKQAEAKEPALGGYIYYAPPDYHLLVELDGTLGLSVDAPVHFSRPSIDVLFDSAAQAYESGLLGVLLSGASTDGATGLKSIHDAGGITIVQDPQSAEATAMPRAALDLFRPSHVLSPRAIGSLLSSLQTGTP
jgi:two-component system chemotaxis response regulator CheB